jgi:hypothetical protein
MPVGYAYPGDTRALYCEDIDPRSIAMMNILTSTASRSEKISNLLHMVLATAFGLMSLPVVLFVLRRLV